MSKLNEVHVYGFLERKIEFEYDEDDNPVSATFAVRTVRRKAGMTDVEQYVGYDTVLFFTKERDKVNSIMIAKNKMEKLDEESGFPIEIYGNLVTRQTMSTLTCKECGEEFEAPVYVSYVRPTAINTLFSRPKNSPFLFVMREKSNSINLIGTVKRQPFLLNDKTVILDSQGEQVWIPVDSEEVVFPLAITRNYAVIEDLENTADFPLIAAKTLVEEMDYIQPGSSILVRGSIWNKKVNRVLRCSHCGHENSFEDDVTLIFPFNVEFLFSAKNRYGVGAAIKAFSDDIAIDITQNGETVTEIDKKATLLLDEFAEVRKILYPKTVRRIIPKSDNKVEIEIEDDEEQDVEKITVNKEIKDLQEEVVEKDKERQDLQDRIQNLKNKVNKLYSYLDIQNTKYKKTKKELSQHTARWRKLNENRKKRQKGVANEG